MKLKTKLKFSFLTMIIFPALLLSLMTIGFGNLKIRELKQAYGIEFSMEYMINTVQTIHESTGEIWEKLSRDAAEDSDQFLSQEYQDKWNEELRKKLSFLVVAVDGEICYSGGRDLPKGALRQLPKDAAPSYGTENGQQSNGFYLGGEWKALVKEISLRFSDGKTGSAYIVTTSSAVLPQLRQALIQIIATIFIVLILTSVVLTLWIYRAVATPITRLREATQRIAGGDLDFTLESSGKDEIGDLTRDFELMREQLAEAEKQKKRWDTESRELIGNISHDLKTPLTTIKGYVEGIMDGVADTPEKMDRYVRTIYSKANDMDRLVNELTFYTKIDTNRIPYNFTLLLVSEYFGDCAEEVGMEMEEKGIEFTYENTADRDDRIIADPEQLRRVIGNIIGNSVKYMDKTPGRLRIQVCDDGDFVQVRIEDNGKGMNVKELPYIFDRFYRTDASRCSAQGGSGIGLSIARKIIEDHGGKIWAGSSPGNGTTIYFVLRRMMGETHG